MIGIAIYVMLVSRSWKIPQAHGVAHVTGEPFVWAIALPVLTVFLIANAVWGVMLFRHKQLKGRLWWVFSALSWLVALGVDFSHH